jgi:acetyltransferase-like isoleucine patch superfamily enzyme
MKYLFYLLSKAIKKLQIPSIRLSKIDKKSKVMSSCNIYKSSVGKYSYIGYNCQIIHSKIGNFCSIANNVIIGGAKHPLDFVSTSPVFIKGRNVLRTNFNSKVFEQYKETFIGNDVWIGNNAILKGGITISDGAVIGMGAVVTKNVGPYEVWAGNPAKLINKRFEEKDINKLLNLKWWDLEDEKLRQVSLYIDDPKEFINKF